MTSKSFNIGNVSIGQGKCFIIGEIAQSHDGSLGMAHAYVDAVANAGADAVKFQTHIADAESSPDEPWRVKFSRQDKTRFDYWKRMEFEASQWKGLKEHAEDRGLIFLSSPFSIEGIDLLQNLGIQGWKVASGEINNALLLKHLAKTNKPVMLSSGMSTMEEIDSAIEILADADVPYSVMQCTSLYPTPPEKTGLHLIKDLRHRYECPVGYSDHSGKVATGVAAVTLGAEILEIHVTMSREMFGPDVIASVTTNEFRELIDGVRFVEKALSNPFKKDQSAYELEDLRKIFTKSLFAASDIAAGQTIKMNDINVKKPGTGIPVKYMDKIIGKRANKEILKGTMIKNEDII
jgi:N-acetylneuraminate synthase